MHVKEHNNMYSLAEYIEVVMGWGELAILSSLFHFGSTEAQMGAVPSAITVCSTDDFYSIPGGIFGTFVVVDATPVKDSHQAFCDWITLF